MCSDTIYKVEKTLIKAASSFREDQRAAYERAINLESEPKAKWVLENILENAVVAERNQGPLCDDTGIPHLLLEVGSKKTICGALLNNIYAGVASGLRKLPGRPMAIKGDDIQRIDQSGGLDIDPGHLSTAPMQIVTTDEDRLRLHILMTGGGPEIRGKTYRIFHKHDAGTVIDEIVSWALAEAGNLGCTPITLAVGIGRSHFEASSLMVQAMAHGNYNKQSRIEKEITRKINESKIGALGLGGDTTVLGTFLKVGPQRASGVRIVSMRPCCCFEPRVASVEL